MSSNINLLIIDDDLSIYNLVNQSSLVNNCEVYSSGKHEDLLSFIRNNDINIVITDVDKNWADGMILLEELKEFDPLLDVIMVGKPLAPESLIDLINLGATEYLTKPLQLNKIQKTLNAILDKMELKRETYILEKRLEKKYFFQGIVGKNPYMLEIFSLIEKISKYFTSVLITGETGTGKEMVARAIHNLSQRQNKNLVICDCVSIPESLFESELFGYTKGAFTGADKDKKGLFEEATDGIIFLDEIGDIPLSIQAKLLRVLEYYQFRPLGSNIIKKVNLKIIAATSQNLRDAIKRGVFREDLFHRLNKVEIYIPPLRERSEDIPLLVRYFLGHYNNKFSKNLNGISQEVQKLFLKYDWPGNVREIENVLESSSMLAKKEFIDINDLPKYLQDSLLSKIKIPFIINENLSTLDELEKEYIIYLLKICRNNLRKTAKILNISRTTLYSKLKKYNISH